MKTSWESALLKSNQTLGDAAELLTKSALRIVLVVDDQRHLLGTVTDGDIRRALARGCQMTIAVNTVMQADPITLNEGDSRQKALNVMRRKNLLHLPILDQYGVVVGREILQDLLFRTPRENPVLLMAGGFGSRLYPLTRDVPKPLLPVGEKPILQMILEQLVDTGFSKFFLSVHYRSKQVMEHFGDGSRWGVKIEYLQEEQPLGTAGALSLLDPDALKQPLVMMNADLLTGLDFSQLLDYHSAHKGLATVCVREYDFQVPYGVVRGDGSLVVEIVEKPIQTFFVNAGIYVLEPAFLSGCRAGQAQDMPDLLQQAVNEGSKISMFPVHESWIDIGGIEQYERAQKWTPDSVG